MFLYENYTPIFDETEFNDDARLQPRDPCPEPSGIKKSMATVLASLNQPINTDVLRHHLIRSKCRIAPKVSFYNQLTIAIRVPIKNNEEREIQTKIFGGQGTIHMTGGNSISECKKAVAILLDCIKKFKTKVNIIGDKEYPSPKYVYCVNNPDINIDDLEFGYKLSNRNFLTNFEFCPGKLYNILKNQEQNVVYNPNRFAGIRFIKNINGSKLTYLIFKSGKTTISIRTDTSVVDEAYHYINDIMKSNYDEIINDKYI